LRVNQELENPPKNFTTILGAIALTL